MIERIDGGYWQDTYQSFSFNGEADLDFEYSMALTYPLNVTNYQVGDMFLPGTINNLLAALDQSYCGSLDSQIDPIFPDVTYPGGYHESDCGNHKPTNVISISYANDEVAFPPTHERRACLEFLKLGLQGVSVIVSTGDFGVAGQSNLCIDPITGQANGSTGHFNPTFPATCPYVTSVGGSQLGANASISDSNQETAFYQVSSSIIGSSGGGFSNVFTTPPYQLGDVQNYLFHERIHLRNISDNFNASGRGFPDVATNAANYVTVIDGQLDTVCKSPISFFQP
jgi:tripeptidyl-peptidase-1